MSESKYALEQKRGYLKGDFEFFHIKDQKNLQFDYHYHDFNKIIIFLSGNVTYLIEGKSYKLKPWDILLVRSDDIHKPIIDSCEPYDRIVVWINSEFLEKHSEPESDLSTCFELASSKSFHLIRPHAAALNDIKHILSQLEAACKSSEFGSRIMKNSLFMQFIVSINRQYVVNDKIKADDIEYDENINKVITYINENLGSNLTIDAIASWFYMSRYYLMHKFKIQTGYSLHNYILQKRLILASTLLKKGKAAQDVCMECGFGDYSSFVRAFKKRYGLSPRNYYKDLKNENPSEYSDNNVHF